MIYFLGDVHGDYALIPALLQSRGIHSSYIVQVGDFGIGFRDPNDEAIALARLNQGLEAANNGLYVIRGNHDDPHIWTSGTAGFSHIRFVPDYSILTIAGRKFLMVGGGISVDRRDRTPGVNWWPEEVFTLNLDLLRDDNGLSAPQDEYAFDKPDLTDLWCVVTHIAPPFVPPYRFNSIVEHYAANDPELMKQLVEERRDVGKLFNFLKKNAKPQFWYFGHYHQHHIVRERGVTFTMLSSGQLLGLDETQKSVKGGKRDAKPTGA